MTEVAHAPGFGEPLAAPPAYAESVPFDLDLSPLRRLVKARARALGLAPARVIDLVLAVGEATANTIRHAGGAGTLRIWHNDAEIVCEVSDLGRIENPRAGQLPPPAGTRGGQGLWIIQQACDRVELRSSEAGTVIRMHMLRNA